MDDTTQTTRPSPDPAGIKRADAARRARGWIVRHWRLSAVGAVVLIALLVAAKMSLSGGGTQAILTPVTKGDVEDTVSALGDLEPRDYVDVGAQVSGQLKAIHVEIGDQVKEGDLLAEIDAAVQSAKVEASRAQLQNLEAQLKDKEAQAKLAAWQLKQQSALKKQNATSQDEFESAQAAADSAVAQVDALKAQIVETQSSLSGDEVTLSYSKIVAPMTGTVVSLDAKQGQTLNANQTAPILMRIADLTTMTVWTQVSEADVSKLKVGMDAYFTTLGGSKRWTGTLQQILPTPEVENNVVLYTALFDVANPDGALMTQMSAQVFFVRSAAHDVLVAPLSALTAVPGKKDTYRATVVSDSGHQETREVTIGVKNRVSAEVLSGLKEGDKLLAGHRSETKTNTNGSRPRMGF